jgi:hypothetical protein
MKQILIITFIISSIQFSYGQIFTGYHNENNSIHDLTFRIKKDSTINLIYQINNKAVYAEYIGKIKRINDTLYSVSGKLITSQYFMKAPYEDSITIQMDSAIARQIDKISIEYSNGETIDISKYDKKWREFYGISIPNKMLLYNAKKNKNYIFITINRKNNITDEFLKFQIPFGSASYFSTGDLIAFEIVIKHNFAWIIGEPPVEFGNLKMKKK